MNGPIPQPDTEIPVAKLRFLSKLNARAMYPALKMSPSPIPRTKSFCVYFYFLTYQKTGLDQGFQAKIL